MASPAAGSGGGADPSGGQATRAEAAQAEVERAIDAPVGNPEEALLAYGVHLTEEKWMELWTRIGARKRAASLRQKYEVSVEAKKQEAQQRLADVRERRNRLLEELCGNPADRKSKLLDLAGLDAEEEQVQETVAVFTAKEKEALDASAEKEAETTAAGAAAMAPDAGGHGTVPEAPGEPEVEVEPSAEERREIEEHLRAIYKRYNPSKLLKLEYVCDKYEATGQFYEYYSTV